MKNQYLMDMTLVCVLLLLWGINLSCNDEGDLSCKISENYTEVEVRTVLNVSEYQNQDKTRATQLVLAGDMGTEENIIHNITVFQFDGNGDDTDPLVVLRYVEKDLDHLKLGLMQPKSNPDKEQFLYFVANAGEQLVDFTGTYGELRQKLIPVNDGGIADGVMVLVASLKTKVSALQDIRITFKRKLAKINVTCSVAAGITFTPARLQLRNVPKSFMLEDASEVIPSASDDNFQNYLSITERITEGYTWYMPENKRGIGNASSPLDKTESTAPSGQANYCTYVELSGLYQENSTSKLVSYKVYLGKDNTSDYNVEANYSYNVNITVKGVNESDNRLTVVTIPAAEQPANCYMAVPGKTVVIDMLKSPGEAVPSSGVDYVARVGSVSANNIKSIGIVWQTENTPDGLIQDLTYLEATGQAMFKVTSGAAGNLLLAAYSQSGQQGEILWSWHIWISNYIPDNSHSVNSVIWMDRDLGALSAETGEAAITGYAYQWGRKDPFPLSTSLSAVIQRPLYDANGNYLRSGADLKTITPENGDWITKSITEPGAFYLCTGTEISSEKWWGNSTVLLWNNEFSKKTMFDPCPAGWRLPTSANFSGKTSDESKQMATYWGGLWFPWAAYMTFNGGTIGQNGKTCVHWTSELAYAMERVTTRINRHCGNGYIGRCVKLQ